MDDVPLPLGLPEEDDIPVHPLAALFPMLPDDELQELAEDIAENGLRNPIVRDSDGQIVDGRNRLKACRLAGVEPTFQHINGEDVRAFIASQNVNRRHLTKGQRAMALAMIYPGPEKGGRGHRSERAAETATVSATRLRQARLVLRYGEEDLAAGVMAGKSLDDAYTDACKRRDAKGTDETRIAELRTEAPDLAALFDEEQLKLDDAWAALRRRREVAAEQERNIRAAYLRIAEGVYRNSIALANDEFDEGLRERLDDPKFRNELIERLRIGVDGAGTAADMRAGFKAIEKLIRELTR